MLHLGTIFNTIDVASPIGSYIMSVRVTGYIYDKEASGHRTCYGTHCFMLSYCIFAAVSLLGSLVALILFFRTRRFYTMVLLNRIQHSSRGYMCIQAQATDVMSFWLKSALIVMPSY